MPDVIRPFQNKRESVFCCKTMSASGIGGHHGLDVWSYVARLGVHMRGAGDDFFAEGDSMCAMRTCQYMTQVDIEEFLHKDYEEFACSVPTCQARFSQLIDSETHYNAKHRHACSQCKKCLPSAHLLDLHLSETHDSYFQLLSAKKPSFQCFLETCLDRFWSPKDRREHCIQIHSFPKNFKFDATSRKSSSTSRHSKASSSSPQEVRKRQPRESSKKQKARPASVFVAPMETDQIDGNLKTLSSTPPTNSRLPRRLSLNSSSNKSPDKESPMKDTTPEVSLRYNWGFKRILKNRCKFPILKRKFNRCLSSFQQLQGAIFFGKNGSTFDS